MSEQPSGRCGEQGLLVKAFYRSEHFNVASSGGHKIDHDSGTRIIGSNGRNNTNNQIQRVDSDGLKRRAYR